MSDLDSEEEEEDVANTGDTHRGPHIVRISDEEAEIESEAESDSELHI